MSTADEVISSLEQARHKLVDAKNKGLQGASLLGKAQHTVGHTLGRSGAGSPLLAQMRVKEKAIVAQVMALDALVTRVDAAIAEARGAGGGSGAPRGLARGMAGTAGPAPRSAAGS